MSLPWSVRNEGTNFEYYVLHLYTVAHLSMARKDRLVILEKLVKYQGGNTQ